MDETYDVVVVGAGLAGLTAAATAAGAGLSVLVLDPQDGGGRAATDQVGRFRFNRGAHALGRAGAGRKVLGRLGIEVVGHGPPLKGAQGRLGDRVGLLPVSAPTLALSPLLSGREKIAAGRILAGVRRWRPDNLAGLTVSEWLDELGLEGTVRDLMLMLIRLTTYVTDVDRVSADVVAGQLQAVLSDGVDYLQDGWSQLVVGLGRAARNHGARLDLSRRVQQVVPDSGRVRVASSAGDVLASRVVLAAGTPTASAALLPVAPAGWERVGPPARVACLDAGLPFVPPTAVLLGIDRPLYVSRHGSPPSGLAPASGAMYQAMWYLQSDDDPTPDEGRAVLTDHYRAAQIDLDQAEEVRYLHRMQACAALPTTGTGGLPGRPGVETGLPGVLVAGDWVGPTGHIADAALASGEAAGQAAAEGIRHDRTIHAVA